MFEACKEGTHGEWRFASSLTTDFQNLVDFEFYLDPYCIDLDKKYVSEFRPRGHGSLQTFCVELARAAWVRDKLILRSFLCITV